MRFKITAVTKITDGDTVHVTVDLGFKISASVIVRLVKINCPEIISQPGVVARDVSHFWMHAYPEYYLDCHGQDKYAGRWLGTITNNKGDSLNKYLLDSGHAKSV